MKKVIAIISTIIIIGFIAYIIDYNKITAGEKPIFMFPIENKEKKTVNYYGLGYKLVREISISKDEKLYDDKKLYLGLWVYTKEIKVKRPFSSYDFTVETRIDYSCANERYLYYLTENQNYYYTYCFSDVKINLKNEALSLNEALKQKKINMTSITKEMKLKETKEDGSVIYTDDGTSGFTNQGLTVIKCLNNNYYIATANFEYNEEYCK